jgi:hypothetical protein
LTARDSAATITSCEKSVITGSLQHAPNDRTPRDRILPAPTARNARNHPRHRIGSKNTYYDGMENSPCSAPGSQCMILSVDDMDNADARSEEVKQGSQML